MSELIVEMDEFVCTTDPDTRLITYGISTCIAFAVNGFYINDDEERVPFAALYHWSGFSSEEKDPKGHMKKVMKQFLTNIRDHLYLSTMHPIVLSNFHFIGGEKEQFNDEGKLLVSGTAKEVNALVYTVEHFGFNKRQFTLASGATKHSHFLTDNEDTIDISVQTNNCDFILQSTKVSDESSYKDEPKISRRPG